MTAQAAVAAGQHPTGAATTAANGGSSGMLSGAPAPDGRLAMKKDVSPVPDGSRGGGLSAAGAALSGSRGGTPAADVRLGVGSASPAVGAAGTPEAAGAAAAAEALPSKEEEEQRRLEDEILAEGQAIAGVRALLAKAFSRPAEEPAVPRGHWSFVLQEAAWLANDMAQERLWKRAAAMALGYEVAKLRGQFGLRPPPEGQRKYHDEIAALRAAAAAGGVKGDGGGAGRRSVRGGTGGEANGASAAAALKLEAADDPIFREFSFELTLPGTPPNDDFAAALTFQHDDALQEALAAQLMQSDIERMMREEMAAREYRFEYEAALASHHMAVQDQNRRAMRLDADMADAGLAPMDEDAADEDYDGKKAKNRKRVRSGYLLDEFASLGPGAAEETESVGGGGPPKKVVAGAAPGAAGSSQRQFIEDTYLQRKRRRERYKDVDADYDVGQETAGRYGTRANRAIANRAGASRAQDPSKRKQQLGRADSFAQGVPGGGGGAMMRGGQRAAPGSVPGPVLWSKPEDDLLLAITHEFGVNWTMVSEVLSLSLSMQGIFRPPHLCKQRFRQITTPILQGQAAPGAPPGHELGPVDYSEEKALMALYQAMSKQQARELIVMSLPVHDDVMMRMLEALVQVGATAKQRRQAEEKRNEQGRKMADAHPSHQVVHQSIMAKTGGKHLTPQELAVQVDVAYAQQAKQQQMLQQQAQQAAQLQAQQSAAPPAPGQQGGGGGPGPGPGPPAQGMPAPGPGVAAGTPAGVGGLPAAQQQQQQQQQQGMAGAPTPPLPTSMPPPHGMGQAGGQQQAGGAAGGGMQAVGQPGQPGAAMPSPAGAPGHAPAPRPAQPQITLQQLNHILETGKLPNGQPLEPNMRKAIENKKNDYLNQMAAMQQRQMQMQAMQQQQAQQAQQQAGAPPSAAAQAAMQAAQQAAQAQAAGMRPAMPMQGVFRPTMSGQPGMAAPPMPGQQMGQQMGMQAGMPQQMMAQMPGMQGGMQPMQQLSPQQQQQLFAQQIAMQQAVAAQQQAAVAAAAGAQQAGGQQGGQQQGG